MNTIIRRMTGTAAAAAMAALGACDSGTDLENVLDGPIDFNVATMVAEATVDDVASMVVDGAPDGAIVAGDAIIRTRTRTFFDADGVEMQAFDPLLTESIVITVDIEGTVNRPGWSATIDRSRTKTVTGLAGEETQRTWNASGTNLVTRSRFVDEGVGRTYELNGSSNAVDVVVALPRSENPWPLSGTVTHDVTVVVTQGDEQRTRERTVVITFNGTQFVTAIVNGEEFEIDLADRRGSRPTRVR